MKVLIAEDDKASRTILARQVLQMGCTVVEAEDGARAWEAYQREQPALVITDWMMPEMSGPELCRRIRSVKRPDYTYIIILTALEKARAYAGGMSSGADDFIVKPADTAELAVRLGVAKRILSLQRQMRQLEELLPICPRCKRIHAGGEKWEPVELYITQRSEAKFSHGICPECYASIVEPQLAEIKRRKG